MWFWSANFGNRELRMVQKTLEICVSETHASGNREVWIKDLSHPSNVYSRCKGKSEKGIKGHKEGSQKGKQRPLCYIDGHPPHPKSTSTSWRMLQEQSQVWTYVRVHPGESSQEPSQVWKIPRRQLDVNGEKHSQPIHHRGAVHKHHRGNGWCRNKGNYRSLLRKRKRTSIMCVANLHSLPWNKIRTTLKAKMNLRACIGKPLPSRCSSSSGGSSNIVSVHPRTKSNYRKGQNPSRRQNKDYNSWMTDVQKNIPSRLSSSSMSTSTPWWKWKEKIGKISRYHTSSIENGEVYKIPKVTGKRIHVWGLVALPSPQKLQICKLGDIRAIRRP